jgi:hypothetical protein
MGRHFVDLFMGRHLVDLITGYDIAYLLINANIVVSITSDEVVNLLINLWSVINHSRLSRFIQGSRHRQFVLVVHFIMRIKSLHEN